MYDTIQNHENVLNLIVKRKLNSITVQQFVYYSSYLNFALQCKVILEGWMSWVSSRNLLEQFNFGVPSWAMGAAKKTKQLLNSPSNRFPLNHLS